ncbi:MAG: metalloregulator ArsR/SmtB family transcription factor [Pirellulales bacterium]|nr:metalloregulator ArsR/SmtB family transcription factor [Pirellulales bacterium]
MSKKSKADGPVSSKVLDEVFQALAHPMRRQILIVLYAREGRMTAGEIADRFKCSWPTTTRHLGVLETAGVLDVTKQGRNRVYSLTVQPLLRSADWIYSWAGLAAASSANEGWKALPYATMRNATPPKKPVAAKERATKTRQRQSQKKVKQNRTNK